MASFIEDATATARIPVRIYYEDTDAGGLVHHSNYLRYFERGREHLLGCNKLTELFEESQRSFVVAGMEVVYKKGAVWGDLLEVRTTTIVHSPYRVEFRQDVYRNEELLVEGHVFMATVQGSGTSMKLCPFPDYILNGEVPGLAGENGAGTASAAGGATAAAAVPRKRLPPPRKKVGGGRAEDDSWRSFGDGLPWLMTVYLDDTDFTNISYNANYLKWMERARADSIGISNLASLRRGTEGGEPGCGAAIYNLKMSFKRGANFGDRVIITTKAKLESDFRVAFKHELRLFKVGGDSHKSEDDASSITNEMIAAMPLLVTAEISLIFLSAGGSGNLVKLPNVVLTMMK